MNKFSIVKESKELLLFVAMMLLTTPMIAAATPTWAKVLSGIVCVLSTIGIILSMIRMTKQEEKDTVEIPRIAGSQWEAKVITDVKCNTRLYVNPGENCMLVVYNSKEDFLKSVPNGLANKRFVIKI